MIWKIKLQVCSQFTRHACFPYMPQAIVFGAIFVAMSPLPPVSQEMTTLWLFSVSLLDFKVLKMHRSSRSCHSIYAVMRHSQEVSRFPFSQCGCIKTKKVSLIEVPSLGVVNFAALQGFWYNSVLRQEWVEESHFCEGYFCALFATSAGVLRFASHRKPGGFRNAAMREGRVSCLVCLVGWKRGKWEVKFIPNLKISKNCVSCLVFLPPGFCNQDREGGCSRVLLKNFFFHCLLKRHKNSPQNVVSPSKAGSCNRSKKGKFWSSVFYPGKTKKSLYVRAKPP